MPPLQKIVSHGPGQQNQSAFPRHFVPSPGHPSEQQPRVGSRRSSDRHPITLRDSNRDKQNHHHGDQRFQHPAQPRRRKQIAQVRDGIHASPLRLQRLGRKHQASLRQARQQRDGPHRGERTRHGVRQRRPHGGNN